MKDEEARTHQTLVRSRETFAQWVNEFVEGGVARQKFEHMKTMILEAEAQAAAHGAGRTEAKQGTQSINDAREALLADLFAIREAGKVLGVEDKFPYPPRNNDEDLLQMAGTYATNALPLKTQLIAHELPSDFLEDLVADKAAFQAAMSDRTNAVGDHISARRRFLAALASGVNDLRDLTSLVKIKFADDPGKLAEWLAASHIERPARRAKGGGGTPETPTTPPSP